MKFISLLHFATKCDIIIYNTTIQYAKKNLFLDLSMLYSSPVSNTDDILDYIPTQYIAEYVKSKGYDGIAFSSSLVPEINKRHPDRFNIVVFNYNKWKS